MTSNDTKNSRRGPRIDLVWLFPILAAAAVGYMLFDSFTRRGPIVEIVFESAVGVVDEKTPIRHRGVQIGRVHAVRADPANDRVIVEGRLDRDAADFALEGTRYWIEYPQIGLDGVKSLDTLISGPYIAAHPGAGDASFDFEGTLQRPPGVAGAADLRVTLLAEALDSVRRDSPVLHKGVEVGFVDSVAYAEDSEDVSIGVVIREGFRHLVLADSFFWESSGLRVEASLATGVEIDTSSARTIINGGVSFSNPEGSEAEAVADGHVARLYPDELLASTAYVPISIQFTDARGLVPGVTPIRYRGVDVGFVSDMELNAGLQGVTVSAKLIDRYGILASQNTQFWIARPKLSLLSSGPQSLDPLTSGTYIAVRAGSGEPRSEFVGLDSSPARPEFGPGLDVVLRTPSLGRVSIGSPVYYRQAVVGRVTAIDLSRDGGAVLVYAAIEPRYAPLVRDDTRFWEVGGIQITTGLATFTVEFETLESVLNGGLAFATPPQPGDSQPLTDGAVFDIDEEPQDAWLEWAPGVLLGSGG